MGLVIIPFQFVLFRYLLGGLLINYIANIISMNPFIKNSKTGFHDDLLNRTSHYCKLLLTSTTIDNRLRNAHRYLLKQKGQQGKEARRQQQNQELMKALIEIDRKAGTYRSFSVDQPTASKSMKNKYRERQKSTAISEQNVRLYRKLVTQPTDFSPKKIKEFDEQVTRYSRLIRHPFLEVCQMDQEFYQTYRHQLARVNLGPSRRNTVDLASGADNGGRLRGKKNRKMRKPTRQIIPEQTIEDNPE